MGHFSVPLPISALCSYGLITQNDQKEYNKSSVVEIAFFSRSWLSFTLNTMKMYKKKLQEIYTAWLINFLLNYLTNEKVQILFYNV